MRRRLLLTWTFSLEVLLCKRRIYTPPKASTHQARGRSSYGPTEQRPMKRPPSARSSSKAQRQRDHLLKEWQHLRFPQSNTIFGYLGNLFAIRNCNFRDNARILSIACYSWDSSETIDSLFFELATLFEGLSIAKTHTYTASQQIHE